MSKSQQEPTQAHFDELLSLIYESSINKEVWHSFLTRLSYLVHSHVAFLREQNLMDGTLGFQINTYHDDTCFSLYQGYYYLIDPFIDLVKHAPTGTMIRSTDYFNDNALKEEECFTDYINPQERHHVMGGFIDRDNERSTTLVLQRGIHQGSFSDEQLDLVQQLAPHLKRALRIGRHIETMQAESKHKSKIVNRLQACTIVLDRHYRPLWMNASAEKLLKSDQELKLGKRGLQASNAEETGALHRLLDTASSLGKKSKAPVSDQLLLQSSDQPPKILLAMPYSESLGKNFAPATQAAVILFICPQNQSDHNAQILAQLFNLTAAETRLLKSLGQGATLDQYAIESSVTKNTARTQLRAVLAKTQLSRQADLVLLYQQIPLIPRN